MGLCGVLEYVEVDVDSLIKASTTELYKNKVISADQKTIDVLSK